MAAALRAEDLCPNHPVARVDLLVDGFRARRREERWPAAAGVVLRFGGEQLRAAAGAAVAARIEDVVVFARERALRALLAQHAVLLRRQLGPPLLLGFRDLRHLRQRS